MDDHAVAGGGQRVAEVNLKLEDIYRKVDEFLEFSFFRNSSFITKNFINFFYNLWKRSFVHRSASGHGRGGGRGLAIAETD